jgi:hypothetical protein
MLSLSGQFANVADEVLRKTTKDFTSEMRAVREPNFHSVCTDAVLQLQEAAQHATEYDGEAPAPAGDDTEAEDDSLRSLLDHFESKVACRTFAFGCFVIVAFLPRCKGWVACHWTQKRSNFGRTPLRCHAIHQPSGFDLCVFSNVIVGRVSNTGLSNGRRVNKR